MSNTFKDSRGITHAIHARYGHPCAHPDGWMTLKAPCGRRVKHHDRQKNRFTSSRVDCVTCLAETLQEA